MGIPVQMRLELVRGARRIMAPTLLLALVMALGTQLSHQPPGGLELPAARAREDIWSLGLLLLLPLACLHYAQGARAREHTFLTSFPSGRSKERGAAGFATLLICLATLAGIGALAESSIPNESALRHTRSVDLGAPRRIVPGEELALVLDPGKRSSDARISLEVASGGGAGPTTIVRLELIGQEHAQIEHLIDGRGRVELSIPKGKETVQVVLVCLGPGDAVVPGGRCLTLLEKVPSVRRASLEIGARAAGVLALVLLVVALVRGFLKPGMATTLALGLTLLGASSPVLPVEQLLEGLRLAAEGRLPAAPQWREFSALWIFLGLLGWSTLGLQGRRQK